MKRNKFLLSVLPMLITGHTYAQEYFYSKATNLIFPSSGPKIISLSTDPATIPNDSATIRIYWNKCSINFTSHINFYIDNGSLQLLKDLTYTPPSPCQNADTIKVEASKIYDALDYSRSIGTENLYFEFLGFSYNNCSCFSVSAIDSFIITYPQMAADFRIDSTDYCEGDSVRFHDLNTHPSVQRLWRFPGGIPAMSTDSNPSVYYPVAGYYDVTLIVSNPYGTDSIVSANRIHISEGGDVDAGTDLSVCQGDSVQLSASAIGTSFVWMSDSTISSPFSLNTFVHPFQTTNYILWSGGWLTCSNYDTVQVTVLPVTVPAIQINGSILTSSPAVAYQWYRNDTLIAGAIFQNYQATGSGNYSVETTDNNGCQSRSASVSFSTTGISDAFTQSHFLVKDYSDYLEINAITEPVRCVQLFSASGAELFKVEASENQTRMILPVDQLKNGIYIISISGKQGSKGRFKYIH